MMKLHFFQCCMNVKTCYSRYSIHFMFYYTQHNVHESVMLKTSHTAYIYSYIT